MTFLRERGWTIAGVLAPAASMLVHGLVAWYERPFSFVLGFGGHVLLIGATALVFVEYESWRAKQGGRA